MTWFATDSVLMALLGMAGRGFLLLAAAALAAAALRRGPAAARHWVWSLAVAGLLALPVASAVAPEWRVAVPESLAALVPGADSPDVEGGAPFPIVYIGAESLGGWVTGDAAGAASTSVASGAPLSGWLLGAWAAGSLVLLGLLALGHLAVRGFERRSGTFPLGRVTELAASLRRAMGIHRTVRLLRGPADAMPMSWGVWRPVILLPEGAERWSEARLRTVLLHELAHVARRDCLTQLLAEVAVALHWPNPLAWLAARRLRLEREHACDDVVVLAGSRPSEYATELLDLAGALRVRSPAARLTAAMARPAELHGRLRAILEEGRSRAWTAGRRGAAAVVCAGVVMATAALTPAGEVVRGGGGEAERASAEAAVGQDAGEGDSAESWVADPVGGRDSSESGGTERPRDSGLASMIDGGAAMPRTASLPSRPPEARIAIVPVESLNGSDEARITPMKVAAIRGRIVEAATSALIPNATVRVQGTRLIAISSSVGNYALMLPGGTYDLVVEREGYVTQTRTVALTEDAELVTNFRLDREGSAPRSLPRPPGAGQTAPRDLVIGSGGDTIQVPGLRVGGPPPIVFIDGVRIMAGESVLEQLDPNDIERVEVIKGEAAAAFYGPDAAGGVIRIFLKDGASPTRIRLRDGTVTDTISGTKVSAEEMLVLLAGPRRIPPR